MHVCMSVHRHPVAVWDDNSIHPLYGATFSTSMLYDDHKGSLHTSYDIVTLLWQQKNLIFYCVHSVCVDEYDGVCTVCM